MSRGLDEIGIASDGLWCDVSAFELMLGSGDLAGALDLYKGDLLPGFYVNAAPEFDQWLSNERTRLRRAAYNAAWKLAEDAERSGALSAAGAWGHKAVDLCLNNELHVQDLIRLLDRTGDSSGAMETYDAFAARLERECDSRPSAETRQIVTAIRTRMQGDAQSAPRSVVRPTGTLERPGIAQSESSTPAEPSAQINIATQPPPRRRALHPVRIAGLTLAACVTAILVYIQVQRGGASPGLGTTASHRASIIVRQFGSATAQPGAANAAAALTLALVDQLAQVRSFDVSSVDGANRRTPGRPSSDIPRIEVAGTLVESSDEVRITVEMVDAASGRVFKTATFKHPNAELIPVVDSLSLAIASSVRTAVGRELQLRAWTLGAGNDRAYLLMQEADAARERATELAAVGNFRAATRAFASADSTLLEVERAFPRAVEPMTERARTLQALGAMSMLPPIGDRAHGKALLEHARAEALRAVAQAPGDAAAQETLGSIAYWYWLTVPTSLDSTRALRDQADHSLRAAVELDPSRAAAWGLLSALLYARADYVGASLTAERAYRADAFLRSPETILDLLFITSQEIGDTTASRHWCGEIRHRLGRDWLSGYCQLRLVLSGPITTDDHAIARAWRAAQDGSDSSAQPAHVSASLQMLVAATIARRGLRDSARAVIEDAIRRGGRDPELEPAEAEARLALGQRDSAVALLTHYAALKPLHRAGVVRSRRFSTLPNLKQTLDSIGIPAARHMGYADGR